MLLSERFLALAQQQLDCFEGEEGIARLVLYVARGQDGTEPGLEMVHQWPDSATPLPPVETDPALRAPAAERRWYPLREGNLLLGALRAECSSAATWTRGLDRRLEACAGALAYNLSLDLERSRLSHQLQLQREQLDLVVHQLRNPLAALRTYAQLLLRRLEPESQHRPLVENLLDEQGRLDRYITAIDGIGRESRLLEAQGSSALLLPPMLPSRQKQSLRSLLAPLADRAAATATLQGRSWSSPQPWPDWSEVERPGEDGVVAEIIANLLENAFRYSPSGAPLGLHLSNQGDQRGICIWDGGPAIHPSEREQIFEQGVRGERSRERSGSGLGLALARQLAEDRGGELRLLCNPQTLSPELPVEGNAFLLTLPAEAPATPT